MTTQHADRELLQQALEALEYIEHNYMSLPKSGKTAITALRERLAQPEQEPDMTNFKPLIERLRDLEKNMGSAIYEDAQTCGEAANVIEKLLGRLAQPVQEPVAWLHTKIEGVAVPHRPADLDKHPDRWEALYKTPPPCPTCEALARTVMLDQTYHDAQRKPLTVDEILECWKQAYEPGRREHDNAARMARAIEAAHGIKGS